MITVAVYGTLKRGFRNNFLLENAEFLGEAISGSPFRMYCIGFPVLLPGTADEPGLRVAVELYRVTRKELARLDRLEGNGRMYQRARRRFRFKGTSQRAWVYIGGEGFKARYMNKVIPTGQLNVWAGAATALGAPTLLEKA